jgi:hypothetical protein
MVVALDSYLWSKRPDELAPELRAVVERETDPTKEGPTDRADAQDTNRNNEQLQLHPSLEDPLVRRSICWQEWCCSKMLLPEGNWILRLRMA